ncbi:MAG: hypothetical protein KDD33_13085, partial [Bdellovibrionales bacterium]|nr:hypothetical protein [Bdellovibrionales bacterium]
AKGMKHLELHQLMPSTSIPTGNAIYRPKHYNHGQSDTLPDDPGTPWGEGGGEFGRIKDYGKIEKVAYALYHVIDYPYVLIRRGIEGHVNARLVVNGQGQCEWSYTKIGGEKPELRLKVLLILKQFCRSDFWHHLKIRESSNLDISFHFDVKSMESDVKYSVTGNTIFYRIPGRQGTGMWQIGPIKGHFIYPMVFLDPAWVMENWSRFVEGNDPMEIYRQVKEIRKFDGVPR